MSDVAIRAAGINERSAQVIIKPASWIAHIDFVKQLILSNNILVSFLGEQGSGKTVFANLLQTEVPKKIKPHMIVANPLIDNATFLQQLAILLDVSVEPSIENFVAHSNEHKSHQLLIIDDAHFLTATFIEDILKALQQQDQGGYFHVCLFSNFSLVSIYNKLAQDTYTDMIHSIELGSLSESETKTYVVQNLLSISGAEKLVTDERIEQFYQLTAGHIEAINRQMASFFNYNPTQSLYKVKQIRQVGIAAGLFLLATGGVYFWLSQDIQPPPAQLANMASIMIATPEVQIEPELSSQIPGYNVAAMRQAIEATPLRRVDLTSDTNEEDTAPDDSLVVMDKVIVAPKVLQVKEKENLPVIEKSAQTVAKMTPKQRASAAVIKPAVERGRYTIQLLAGHNKDQLKRFAAAHHFNAKTEIHQVLRQGKNWYVLTLGVYPKHDLAKQAVNRLPGDVAQFRPWVRLISDLKAAG